MNIEKLIHNMTYHSPDVETQEDLSRARELFLLLAGDIGALDLDVDPRCSALVGTKIEEALMWLTKGIVIKAAERKS